MATEPQPQLVIEGGPDPDRVVPLVDTVTLGREAGNDVVVPEASASRNHAQIIKTDEGFRLRDLASTNGTFVNNTRITTEDYLLYDGDRIRLGAGEVTLVFQSAVTAPAEVEEEPEPVEAAPAEPAAPVPTLVHSAVVAPEIERQEAVEAPDELVPVGEAALVEVEVEEEPLPPTTTIGRLMLRLGIGGKPAKVTEPEEVGAPTDEIRPEFLSLFQKLGRAVRYWREELDLLRRRRVLAMSVEEGVIRAVVFQGQEVVAWGKADPADEGIDAVDREADIGRAGELLRELRAHRARVLTDLPLYTPLIRHIRLPEKKEKYINDILISEVMETIPFTQDEVDVKWQVTDDVAQRAMAIAVRKEEIDAHVEQMKEAGSGPTSTFARAASLAAVAGRPNAMVAHIGRSQTGVVLVRNGVPQRVHQTALSGSDQSVEAQAEAVVTAVEQVEGFDQTGEGGLVRRDLPLVIAGRVADNGNIVEELRELLQREVISVASEVEGPEEFPVEEYANCVGLALLDSNRPKGWSKVPRAGSVYLNLLSPRHLPAPFPIGVIAVFVVLGLFGVSAINLADRVFAVTADADAATQKLARINANAREYTGSVITAKDTLLESKVARQQALTLERRVESLRAEVLALRVRFDRVATVTKGVLPPKVKVSVSLEQGKFSLAGTAPNYGDIVRYSEAIRAAKGSDGEALFQDVSVEKVVSAGIGLARDSVVNFVIVATPSQPKQKEETGSSE